MAARDVSRTRLLLVDDDRRFCDLARPLLEADFDLTVSHTARDAKVAARRSNPQAAVVDLGLPDGDGIEVIAELSDRSPQIPILVLSVASADGRILAALRAGARGYLFKEDIGRLRCALDELLAGESPMSAGVARLVVAQLQATASAYAEPPVGSEQRGNLTPRELEVINGLRCGLTYQQVGESLGVSTNTVRSYIRSVYEKLEVSSKTEAVLTVMRRGWLA